MNLEELNRLDFKTVADWPLGAKLGLLGVLLTVVVAAGWWFLWSPALESLDESKAREAELKSTYVTKKGQAINLDAYKKQLADIQQSFGALLKQLPNRQEMDALITDVNQAGLGRGLQFELFRPGAESKKEFYAELPIQIKVTGSYHDIAAFTSDVAKLSRIVTIHNISLLPTRGGDLVMEAVAKTYRYLDEEEIAASKPKKQGGKK
ncbi:type 4a pilus biogenesis protein PilO [Betaproteobacteria bacterium SCN2]|jgi:type IV pilus assembly protein PilO|nr:type 4a pilus biogenesis protein PilO [Betaproteobacteria bacterium SCN2]